MAYGNAGMFGPDGLLSINVAGQLFPNKSVPVNVYLTGTTTLATLYTDRTKATAAANPVKTDASGNLTFFADPGQYDINYVPQGASAAVTQTVEVYLDYADKAPGVVGISNFPTYVSHGSTASTARPTGAVVVLWQGSVAPTNALANDLWWDTTNLLQKRYNGTSWDSSGNATYLPRRGPLPSGDTTGVTDAVAIQNAINTALAGEAVVLSGAAPYYTNVALAAKPGVALVGENMNPNSASSTIINVVGNVDGYVLSTVATGLQSGYRIANLTISGGRRPLASYYGVTYLTLENVDLVSGTDAQWYTEGFMEEVSTFNVICQGGQYGFRTAHVNPGGGNYIDKSNFANLRCFGAAINNVRVEVNTSNDVVWNQLWSNTSGQHGFYADGGIRGWTFIEPNTEGNGNTGKNAATTGSITSGSATLTVASGAGIANGDTVTVHGAGPNGGSDLTATVNSGGGTTTLTLSTTASTSVTNAAVTNAIYDDFFFNNTIASSGGIGFLLGTIAGTGAGGKYRYSINAVGVSAGITVVGTSGGSPIYDPSVQVSILNAPNISVRSPNGNLGSNPYIGLVAGVGPSSDGITSPGRLSSPPGGDFYVVMVDSNSNGTGTVGTLRVKVGNPNHSDAVTFYMPNYPAGQVVTFNVDAGFAGVGFYGKTAVHTQPTAAAVTAGYTAGTSTAVTIDGKFTGNVGATAYTLADLVAALKNLGLIAS